MLPLLLDAGGVWERRDSSNSGSEPKLPRRRPDARLRVSLDAAVADGAIAQPDAARWLSDLAAAERRGSFELQMRFVLISAIAV